MFRGQAARPLSAWAIACGGRPGGASRASSPRPFPSLSRPLTYRARVGTVSIMVTADELEAFRQRHGLSIRKLAALVGVSKSTVQRWLEGEVASQDPFRERELRRIMAELDQAARSDS